MIMKRFVKMVLVTMMTIGTAASMTSCDIEFDNDALAEKEQTNVMFEVWGTNWKTVSFRDHESWVDADTYGRSFEVSFKSGIYKSELSVDSYYDNMTNILEPGYSYYNDGGFKVKGKYIYGYNDYENYDSRNEVFRIEVIQFQNDRMDANIYFPGDYKSYRVLMMRTN